MDAYDQSHPDSGMDETLSLKDKLTAIPQLNDIMRIATSPQGKLIIALFLASLGNPDQGIIFHED
ncbi:hypothetical protein [Herpetosiphon llansteffanensis]|uniref:hypothetical protein n=1 Tax=Herpetosiphon llansteffanensis TaxID=2094568 RepID=UPI000D7C12EB|nr:hypothetical protein [Herpetosiphon llansteffanensis]